MRVLVGRLRRVFWGRFFGLDLDLGAVLCFWSVDSCTVVCWLG